MEQIVEGSSRKRAAIACNYCRKRKRRCDGKQPVCTLCREANHNDCRYQEPETVRQYSASQINQSVEILERLERLESLFHPNGAAVVHEPAQASPSPSQGSHMHPLSGVDQESGYTCMLDRVTSTNYTTLDETPPALGSSLSATSGVAGESPQTALPLREDEAAAPMTIPTRHSTTTGSLLQSKQAKKLLGSYPQDLFFRVESKRGLPDELSMIPCQLDQAQLPSVDSSTTSDMLVDHFFTMVNSQHPMLERGDFNILYQQMVEGGLRADDKSALVLVVLALGSAACERPNTQVEAWLPGIQYFTPALQILLVLWPGSFGTSVVLPQALYLAALYYSYLARPLQSWRLVHMASTNLQHIWIQWQTARDVSDTPLDEPVIRVCWAIFVLECDIIAEYHLPRSGIEQVVDDLPFPKCGIPPDLHMLNWLADLSVRRLLNRVHHAMYDCAPGEIGRRRNGDTSVSRHHSVASLVKVSTELNRQLCTWFELLPQAIKPDLDDHEPSLDEVIMILRYRAAGDIIFRPFLHYVCDLPPGTNPPDFVIENALTCLHHCREYLSVVRHRVEASSGSIEIVLHSTLAVTLILTLASLSPYLAHYVQDIDSLQDTAVTVLRKWAFPESSIETMLQIVLAMRHKRRMLL